MGTDEPDGSPAQAYVPLDAAEADERYDRLLVDLEAVRDLLLADGAERWAAWAEGCRRTIAAHDARGLTTLRSGFGGMGSFTDVVLATPEAAAELDRLRSRLAEDSRALLDDLRHG